MSKPNPKPPRLTPQRIERFHKYVDKTPGQGPNGDCWEWQKGRKAKGYGIVAYWKDAVSSHRLAFYLATGKWPTLCVLHKCDNPPCCNPDHLYEGTDADNTADKIRKSRLIRKPEQYQRGDNHFSKRHPELILRGERIGTAKLTADQVELIRNSTCSSRVFTEQYGISKSTVSLIRRGIWWKHIKS